LHQYGLIGYPLSHSFSKKYFSEKFAREGIEDCSYELFPLEDISGLPELIAAHPDLRGLNVTIPHKETVLPYLDELSPGARAVGAVNTIRIDEGKLTGHNTDVFGFGQSLERFLAQEEIGTELWPALRALVLGTGGAAKAVAFVLSEMGIPFKTVSRDNAKGNLTYDDLDRKIMEDHRLIINTTPLGMTPNIDFFPNISYHYLDNRHLLFDLVYNPEETLFLKKGRERGTATKNGLEMLILQAEEAWRIWRG
jgi:shikimate dehydrogenase